MDYYHRIQNASEFIELNIEKDINIDIASKLAFLHSISKGSFKLFQDFLYRRK